MVGFPTVTGVGRVCLGMGLRLTEVQGGDLRGPHDECPAAFHTVSWMQENLGTTVLGLAFCLRWSVNRTD